MAVHDAEINIGVNLDADQFKSSFEKTILQTSQDTQTHLQGLFDDMRGSAAKNWQTLPFAAMHDPNTGNEAASHAFIASMAEDLKRQGIKPGTLGYQSALLSAAMRSSTPNPMDRYHRMLAEGMYYQADEMYPTTALARAVDANYALMEQDWAKDFVTTKRSRGLSAARLNKLTVADLKAKAKAQGITGISGMRKADLINALIQQSKNATQIVDFEGMREYAVEHGLGTWIDPQKEHTADNFKLINSELEKINDKSNKSKKNFGDWSDALKSSLGSITAIGSALGKLGAAAVGAAITVDKLAERQTTSGAKRVDARRAFVGMNALDQLETKVASKAVSLGEDDIYNEILSMSSSIQEYKLLGQGDALPASLLGIFDNLMNSDNPYKTYKESADELYNNLKGMSTTDRATVLMLMNKMGLGSMSGLIGQFLSNEDFAQKYKTPSALFSTKNNPYSTAYAGAELILPDLTKLNESIQASYTAMANDWEKYFGIPFKSWWEETLQNTIVPWTAKLMRRIRHQETNEDIAEQAVAGAIVDYGFNSRSDRLSAVANQAGYVSRALGDYKSFATGRTAHRGAIGGSDITSAIPLKELTAEGRVANAYWNDILRYSKISEKDLGDYPKETVETITRLKYMVQKLKDTDLSAFLENSKKEDIDTALLRAVQMGVYDTGDWQGNFDKVINAALKAGEASQADERIIKLLTDIAANTEVAELMSQNPEFKAFVYNTFSSGTADEMFKVLQK